jgi:hypothetical protein
VIDSISTLLRPNGGRDAISGFEVAFWMTRISPDRSLDMKTKFDIFKKLRDGTPIWIASFDRLEEARNQINRLAVVGPGNYLVYSEEKGLIVERVTKQQECDQDARI